jgi:hypothetical protein
MTGQGSANRIRAHSSFASRPPDKAGRDGYVVGAPSLHAIRWAVAAPRPALAA